MKKIVERSRVHIGHVYKKAFDFHKLEPLVFPALIALFFILSSLEEVIDDVIEGDTHAFDNMVLMWFRNPADMNDPIGPHWVEEIMRDFSALGGIAILTFITLSVAAYFFVTKRKSRGFFLLLAVGTGTLLTNALKAGFDRPRPDLIPLDTYIYTASFPSGHSMMAAVVYLTLGSLLAETQSRKRMKIYVLTIALLMTLLVGFSRVYLGAHWVSDVAAGWLGGTAWALLFWLIERYLISRNKLREKPLS